jgi:hypothetical protein
MTPCVVDRTGPVPAARRPRAALLIVVLVILVAAAAEGWRLPDVTMLIAVVTVAAGTGGPVAIPQLGLATKGS